MSATQTGTVKIGRWTYPATKHADGTVTRNSKTDGSGAEHPTAVRPELFVPDAPVEAKPAKSELSPYDTAMLAQIGNSQGKRTGDSFDFFDDGIVAGSGIWFAHAADQTNNPPAARRAFKSLANKGYVEIGDVDTDAKDRWMYLTAKGAEAALAHAGGSTELPAFKPGHTSGGGNQTKRPGKSSWKLGEKCPQGHTLTAQTLYVMPSGRRQCRDCRSGMPSRKS